MTKKSRDRRRHWRLIKAISRHANLKIKFCEGDNIQISLYNKGGRTDIISLLTEVYFEEVKTSKLSTLTEKTLLK